MTYALPLAVFGLLALFVVPWVAAGIVLLALVVALLEAVVLDDATADRESPLLPR